MKKQFENVQSESCGVGLTDKMPEEKIFRYELQAIERKLAKLEETVNVLTAVSDTLAKNSGIKVDTYKGVVVISKI